jgi:predicted dehydrogenase
MHLEMALGAIRSGMPVLVEKPMTLSLTDAHILADGAMSHDVLTMVGHTHLYSSAFRQLKRNSEALGQLIHTRSCGGNWVAMCLELLGRFPLDIHADRIANVTQPRVDGEAIAITLKSDCGAYSKIHLSNLELQKQRFFEAAYDGGSLVYDDLASDKLVFRAATANVAETVVIDQFMPLTNLVEEFCSAIGRGNRVSDSLALGQKVVEVLAACQETLDLK